MIRTDHRHGAGECPECRQVVDFDRVGRYRRHYAVDSEGRCRLCPASGRDRVGFVQLLRVEPTAEERYSHALRLLHAAQQLG